MCGIVGYVGPQQATPILLKGLQSLEYRGYDSAGLAVYDQSDISVVRSQGKLSSLLAKVSQNTPQGTLGIGHTRWATHGKPSEANAHPHLAHDTVLVHNGIIENYEELKGELSKKGVSFASETDTEVIPWLIDVFLKETSSVEDALFQTLPLLKGAFALLLFSKHEPHKLYVAKNASPLIIGLGKDETFVASDIPALLPYTQDVLALEDGQVAILEAGQTHLFDFDRNAVTFESKKITWTQESAQKGGFEHFMLKEIYEQPERLTDCLRGRIQSTNFDVHLPDIQDTSFVEGVENILMLACGTSYHAALVGQYWLEKFVHVPVSVEIASEYRYRNPYMHKNTLCIAITQSGETADTLAAFSMAQERGAKTLAICNVVDSSIARLAQEVLYTHAGPEIGVASTKAFTTQLTVLALLTLVLAKQRKSLPDQERTELGHDLLALPRVVSETLQGVSKDIMNIAKQFKDVNDFLYLGRGASYPIALEGALKLKEISYIHAEGYMGGELKHGPIALIDDDMPVVALSQRGILNEKMKSNVEEVKARGGQMIVVSERGDERYINIDAHHIKIPPVHELILPIVQCIPMQLLAYHIADERGCDVDQPRNLAKSVTVE